MKRILYLVLALSVLTGCDSFRRLAGRPTSAELARKRAILEQWEAYNRQAAADSLRLADLAEVARQEAADSLAALDSLQQIDGKMLDLKAMGGVPDSGLDNRYYIIVGSFANSDNAEAYLRRSREAGYAGTLIPFRNGYTAVGVCPTDHLPTAISSLKTVRSESLFPADAWILSNDK